MSAPPESCERCRFSVTRNGVLFCRRNPPQVILPFDGMVVSVQPETEPTDWCGEFAAREEAPHA